MLIDLSDSIKNFADDNVSYLLIIANSLSKLPLLMFKITPFLILFSAFYTMRKIVLNRELDIYKASGISIWQFLQPFILITLLWSALALGTLSPLNTIIVPYQKQIQTALNPKKQQDLVNLSTNIVWIVFKESSFSEKIILANQGFIQNNKFYFKNLSILDLDKNKLKQSLLANSGILYNNNLHLRNVVLYEKNNPSPQIYQQMKIPVKIKKTQLRSLSLLPEELFFWQLPTFIKDLKHSGITTTQYSIYFYNLLSLPLTLLAMLFISMRFSLYDIRSGKKIYALVLTTVIGFFIFLISNVISSIASLEMIKPSMLILTSQLIITLVAIHLVLMKEGC